MTLIPNVTDRVPRKSLLTPHLPPCEVAVLTERVQMPTEKKPAPAAAHHNHAPEPTLLIDRPVEDLRTLVAGLTEQLGAVRTRIGAMTQMTADQRQHSSGRLRSDEPEQLVALLNLMDNHPAYFTALARKDRGTDPKKLETGPTREDIERRNILLPALALLDSIRDGVADSILRLGERARSLPMAGYAIADANSEHDEVLAADLAPIQNYFSENARRAARTRKAEAEAKTQADT